MNKRIYFNAGKENIVGEILGNKPDELSDFVYLHGAGEGTKERAKSYFDNVIFDVVPSIIAFDFSGHGESSREPKRRTLKQRVLEAQTAIELHTTQKKLTICGSSMGGYIALKMLPLFDVKNIILFAPGIYDKQAFEVPFDERFSEIIRKPNSWERSDIFSPLENFSGNLLLVIGKDDAVIPPGVIDLIDKHSINTAKKEIIRLDNCSHAISAWLDSDLAHKKQLSEKILNFYGS